MAITEWDDYLIHQTADTFDKVASDDPHFMNRIFLAGNNAEGTLHLMAGLGSYPNVNVMDGFVCVRYQAVQRNIRISRHLTADRANTQLGPLTIKVLEPLKRWGFYLANNDYGIGCSLEFEGRVAPFQYGARAAHYDQPGRFTGSITFEDQQFNADGFIAARDRSWGVRHPGTHSAMEFYLWLQAQFSDFSLCVWCGGRPDSAMRSGIGAILNDDGSVIPFVEIRHRIEFIPGFRSYTKLEMRLKDASGKVRYLIAKPISPECLMRGGDYDDRHGLDKGPFHIEGERWDVSQPIAIDSPLFGVEYPAYQQDLELQLDGAPGIGLVESLFGRSKSWQYKAGW